MVASANWLQGRTVFGGLLAAAAATVARGERPGLPPLRSAQFVFCGPSTGETVLRPEIVREGRSTTTVSVDAFADGGACMRALLTFAAARESRLAHRGLTAPAAPPPAEGVAVFDMPGAPGSTSNFEGRLVGGGVPFAGAARPELLIWLRHRGDVTGLGEAAMLALADTSPPAVFPFLDRPAPISTVTWSLNLTGAECDPAGWFLVSTASRLIGDGYSLQQAAMWTREGEPVLESQQLVAVYD